TPSLTLWESEWVELRTQYAWTKTAGVPALNQLSLQAVWAIGPHKHETYLHALLSCAPPGPPRRPTRGGGPCEGGHLAHDVRGDRARDRGRPRYGDLDRQRRREPALRAAKAELRADVVPGGPVRDDGPRPRALGTGAPRQGEQPESHRGRSGLRGRVRRDRSARRPHDVLACARRHPRIRQSAHL